MLATVVALCAFAGLVAVHPFVGVPLWRDIAAADRSETAGTPRFFAATLAAEPCVLLLLLAAVVAVRLARSARASDAFAVRALCVVAGLKIVQIGLGAAALGDARVEPLRTRRWRVNVIIPALPPRAVTRAPVAV